MLSAQGIFFGVFGAYLYVAANALFLTGYGSDFVPHLYIVSAVGVSAFFFLLASLQQRLAPKIVMACALIALAAMPLAGWTVLKVSQGRWVSMALMVCFMLQVQLVGILLGGQAGRLFNVQQMKRYYPVVASGVAGSMVVSGPTAAMVAERIGGTTNLLLLAALAVGCALVCFVIVVRTFPRQMRQEAPAETEQPQRSLKDVIGNRYVGTILGYQFLSAIGTQMVIYVFLTLADAQFSDIEEMSSFFGAFMGGRNLVCMISSLFIAGFLIARFGMGFGLLANPAGLGLMVIGMLAQTLFGGAEGNVIFYLAVAAYTVDVTLTDGFTVTSLKTAYQVLPSSDRAVVETVVEGVRVPVAFGVTGLMLLGFSAIPGLTSVHILIITLVIIALWASGGLLVFKGYKSSLMAALTKRSLGTGQRIELSDRTSLQVVRNGLGSDKVGEVLYSMDLLEHAAADTLSGMVRPLLDHSRPEVRMEAVALVERRMIPGLGQQVRALLQDKDPGVRGAAATTLMSLEGDALLDEILPLAQEGDPGQRRGALVGLLRDGGIEGIMSAGEHLLRLTRSSEPGERAFAAEVIGAVGIKNFYRPLLKMLEDEDPAVQRAAVTSCGLLDNPVLWPALLERVAWPDVRAAVSHALSLAGAEVIPLLEEALGRQRTSSQERVRIVRVLARIEDNAALSVLGACFDDADPAVRWEVLGALSQRGWQSPAALRARVAELVQEQVQGAARCCRALIDLEEGEPVRMLRDALAHQCGRHRELAYRLLMLIHDGETISLARADLEGASSEKRSLALETLDTLLDQQMKRSVLPLLQVLGPGERVKLFGAERAGEPVAGEQWFSRILAGEAFAGRPGYESVPRRQSA